MEYYKIASGLRELLLKKRDSVLAQKERAVCAGSPVSVWKKAKKNKKAAQGAFFFSQALKTLKQGFIWPPRLSLPAQNQFVNTLKTT